jgi:hypothetical protein
VVKSVAHLNLAEELHVVQLCRIFLESWEILIGWRDFLKICLLGLNSVKSGRSLPTFRWSLLPNLLSTILPWWWRQQIPPGEKFVTIDLTTWCDIRGDSRLVVHSHRQGISCFYGIRAFITVTRERTTEMWTGLRYLRVCMVQWLMFMVTKTRSTKTDVGSSPSALLKKDAFKFLFVFLSVLIQQGISWMYNYDPPVHLPGITQWSGVSQSVGQLVSFLVITPLVG